MRPGGDRLHQRDRPVVAGAEALAFQGPLQNQVTTTVIRYVPLCNTYLCHGKLS